jgi:translation initiation factor 2B subunit (eIF-2B alpha/beta/delta family)
LMAQYLADKGIEVELVTDSAIPGTMARCDVAAVGADSIARGGAMNKVGTFAIALAARSAGRPIHVLSGASKLTPLHPGDLMMTQSHPRPHLTETIHMFEIVPLDLFTSFVTDKGILYPEEITHLIAQGPMAHAWSETEMAGK